MPSGLVTVKGFEIDVEKLYMCWFPDFIWVWILCHILLALPSFWFSHSLLRNCVLRKLLKLCWSSLPMDSNQSESTSLLFFEAPTVWLRGFYTSVKPVDQPWVPDPLWASLALFLTQMCTHSCLSSPSPTIPSATVCLLLLLENEMRFNHESHQTELAWLLSSHSRTDTCMSPVELAATHYEL